jgi:hypothetical protein
MRNLDATIDIVESAPEERDGGATLPLVTETVPIDEDCIGDRWSALDEEHLARLIAIVAMGQADYAAFILRELRPVAPAFTHIALCREAKLKLTVQDDEAKVRTGYPRWQRDGFIFEAISWIAARQTYGGHTLLKTPHVSATSQGLDGLMIELSEDKSTVVTTTVFEDKCTDHPRDTFRDKVMPAFLERHRNDRSAELVATASALLGKAGIDEEAAARLAAAVMDSTQRRYRAAFALTDEYDSQRERKKLFKGYNALEGIEATQRIGAGLIIDGELRAWFDALALRAVAYLNELEAGEV